MYNFFKPIIQQIFSQVSIYQPDPFDECLDYFQFSSKINASFNIFVDISLHSCVNTFVGQMLISATASSKEIQIENSV